MTKLPNMTARKGYRGEGRRKCPGRLEDGASVSTPNLEGLGGGSKELGCDSVPDKRINSRGDCCSYLDGFERAEAGIAKADSNVIAAMMV